MPGEASIRTPTTSSLGAKRSPSAGQGVGGGEAGGTLHARPPAMSQDWITFNAPSARRREPPSPRVVHTYWRLLGPSRRPLRCDLCLTTAGLEVRCGYGGDDLLRSEFANSRSVADAIAATWKAVVLAKGSFVEIPPGVAPDLLTQEGADSIGAEAWRASQGPRRENVSPAGREQHAGSGLQRPRAVGWPRRRCRTSPPRWPHAFSAGRKCHDRPSCFFTIDSATAITS